MEACHTLGHESHLPSLVSSFRTGLRSSRGAGAPATRASATGGPRNRGPSSPGPASGRPHRAGPCAQVFPRQRRCRGRRCDHLQAEAAAPPPHRTAPLRHRISPPRHGVIASHVIASLHLVTASPHLHPGRSSPPEEAPPSPSADRPRGYPAGCCIREVNSHT